MEQILKKIKTFISYEIIPEVKPLFQKIKSNIQKFFISNYFDGFWKKSLVFKGITSRKDFYMIILANILSYLIINLLIYSLGSLLLYVITLAKISIHSLYSINIPFMLLSIIPFGSLCIRRLRDTGLHSSWILLAFIPYIGLIILGFLFARPSKSNDLAILSENDLVLNRGNHSSINSLQWFLILVFLTVVVCVFLGSIIAGNYGFLIGLFTAVSLIIYFIPTFIAYSRKSPSRLSILALNLFLGWSLIGWAIGLIWALRNYKYSSPVRVVNSSKDL